MDLSKPVRVTSTGTELIGYMQLKPHVVAQIKWDRGRVREILAGLGPGDAEIGRFFTKRGTPLQQLGIGDQNRIFCRFQVQGSVSALESTAAPIRDTWTIRAPPLETAKGNKWWYPQLVGGGGTQYLIRDARYLYFTSGTFKLIEAGTKINPY